MKARLLASIAIVLVSLCLSGASLARGCAVGPDAGNFAGADN